MATADPAAAFDAAAAGAPGELPYRHEMQTRFGADFSSVQAYTGRELSALGAHAETIRQRVFAANAHAIVDTLQIEGSSRYQQTRDGEDNITATFCNVFAFDVVTAIGGYLPRTWWTDDAIADLQSGQEVSPNRVVQQTANDLYEWMIVFGVPHFGWEALGSVEEAQAEANAGQIVIILGSTGIPEASGHVSVVMPETAHRTAPTLEQTGGVPVPLQAQAGRENFATNAAELPPDEVRRSGRGAWWAGSEFVPDAAAVEAAADNPWWLSAERVAGVGFFVYRAGRENRGFGMLSIRTPEVSAR